mmetsp:Transcript_8960/g.35112  ORF Transcript_8960/g.35112 Transcript_8960/m.35112 type:complete len:378 (-) Transcript_8960:54-1187(-)
MLWAERMSCSMAAMSGALASSRASRRRLLARTTSRAARLRASAASRAARRARTAALSASVGPAMALRAMVPWLRARMASASAICTRSMASCFSTGRTDSSAAASAASASATALRASLQRLEWWPATTAMCRALTRASCGTAALESVIAGAMPCSAMARLAAGLPATTDAGSGRGGSPPARKALNRASAALRTSSGMTLPGSVLASSSRRARSRSRSAWVTALRTSLVGTAQCRRRMSRRACARRACISGLSGSLRGLEGSAAPPAPLAAAAPSEVLSASWRRAAASVTAAWPRALIVSMAALAEGARRSARSQAAQASRAASRAVSLQVGSASSPVVRELAARAVAMASLACCMASAYSASSAMAKVLAAIAVSTGA